MLTTLSLQLSFKLSLITLGFKLSPLSSFALHSPMGILVWHSESDHRPVQAAHTKCLFNYLFYPHFTHIPSEQHHTSKLIAFHMAFYQ